MIGTTVSSQLIALDVEAYAQLLLAAGFLICVLPRRETWRHVGLSILVLFGLHYIGESSDR